MNQLDLLAQLATLIEQTPLFTHAPFAKEAELHNALDARDSDPFDATWMAHYTALQPLEVTHPLQPEERALISRIRERAFKAAFATSSSADLAGYISDDFDLLARALCLDYESPWLSALLHSYVQGTFPTGDLLSHQSSLSATLQQCANREP